MDNNKHTLTRKELYDLVWAKPLRQLALEYSISDNGLRKICKRMNIPLPKMGHWQKLQYGKKVKIEKLPKDFEGVNEIILSERSKGSKQILFEDSPFKKLKREVESDEKLNFSVPDRLSKQSALIKKAKISLSNNEANSWGNQQGQIHTNRGELSISVAKSNIGRALRFMNTLINLLKQRGHEVYIDENEGYTYALVNDEKIKFSLKEKSKRKVIKGDYYDSHELTPNGILAFQYGNWGTSEYKDGKIQKIEDKLADILVKFELESQHIKEQRKEREAWNKKYEEEKKKKEEIKKRKEDELDNFKNLFISSDLLHKANIIRDYVNTVKEKAIKENKLTDELKHWIDWATKKADWYDPLVDYEDELMEDVDKHTLEPKKKHYW